MEPFVVFYGFEQRQPGNFLKIYISSLLILNLIRTTKIQFWLKNIISQQFCSENYKAFISF